MFCPKCGKGEQTPGTYCRDCGEFLADFSSKFSLLSKVLGVNTPERQVNVNLTISLVTAIISSILLVLLKNFSDSVSARTQSSPPLIVYLLYLFLGLTAVWQFISFIIGLNLKSKLSGRKSGKISTDLSADENAVLSAEAKEFLPPADIENIVPASITEATTKILDNVPRK